MQGKLPKTSRAIRLEAISRYTSVFGKKTKKKTYLSDILLLLLTQCQLNEDLLQLLVAVVDDELLKAVVLQKHEQKGKKKRKQKISPSSLRIFRSLGKCYYRPSKVFIL